LRQDDDLCAKRPFRDYMIVLSEKEELLFRMSKLEENVRLELGGVTLQYDLMS
jgi:hypothetical protein